MKYLFSIVLMLFTIATFSQIEDCVGAYPVCGNGDISLVPTGAGVNDFANPNNYTPDCFRGNNGSKTTWLRLKIKQVGSLGFTIIPDDRTGADRDDYDFAVYQSNDCNNLGHSIRCSTTNPQNAGVGAETGLSSTESETSEGPGADGNGFVRWLDSVQVGEVYYIFIDNFSQDEGYTLQWEGSALLEDRITKEEGGVDLGDDVSFCANETVVLDATITGGVSYVWNTGDRNSSLTVTEAGTYTVTATNSAGCISTDTINVTKLPVPEIRSATVTPNNICEPTSVTFAAEGTAGIYEWFNPSGTKIGEGKTLQLTDQMATNSGTYKVKLTRNNGCTDEKTVDLQINPLPILQISGRTAYCEEETINVSVTGAENYQWFNPLGQVVSTTANFQTTADFRLEGVYTIVGTSAFGCVNNTTFTLDIEPKLDISILDADQVICASEGLTLRAEVNNPSATIQWLNAQNQVVGSNLELNLTALTPEKSGIYTVVATTNIGCEARDVVNVTINPTYLFESEVTPCPGDYFTVPQTGELVQEDKIVNVNLLTTEKCDSVYVYTVDFLDCGSSICKAIPTSFAPNNNNANEQFRPIFSPTCTPVEFTLEVYNRWGEQVATLTNSDDGWNGIYNGQPAQPGEYIWKMTYIFPDNLEKTYTENGAVTLIR